MTSSSSISTRTETYRKQFPALANKAYFNYGGQGPMPQASLDAIAASYRHIQQVGPFSNTINAWVVQEIKQTKEAIARELNVPTSTITLTENVSVGCNIGMWGLDWKAGGHILLTDCEHPGIIAAAKEIGRRFGVTISFCPVRESLNQGDPVEIIANAVQPQTQLVILSHLLWNTGQVLPLGKIVKACKQVNPHVKILVDAAQSVGSLPLTLVEDEVDFYAFTGHKWWCGPEGLGGLYVREESLHSLNPTYIGWRGIVADPQGNPTGWKPDGSRYEIATSAYPLYAGLREAIALHASWGTPQARYQQICQLSKYLWQQLQELPQVRCLRQHPPEAGLVSFQLLNDQHPQLVQFLESKNLMLRTIKNPDCVRACVHYFTLPSEINELVEVIQTF